MDHLIRDVRRDSPEDAAQLADLWNVSDVNWPGSTLLRGVPMTDERMLDRMRRQDLRFMLVAEVDGQIVGCTDAARVPGRDDVAQCALLTVRPEWQSKGCAKSLLLTLLDRITNSGYRQLILDTWSGNLRAIPLYKKLGHFWVPGTSVRMQSFIPAALTMPIARGFFERHAWYQSFRREVTVAPDDIRWHGIQVYPYRFEADGELFAMMVDPQAEAPTAVETGEVSVACRLGCEEVLYGLPCTVIWEITNKRGDGRPLRVELAAEGPPATDLAVAETFEVTDALRLERSFTVSPDADLPGPGLPQQAIRSRLLLDDIPVELGTGLRPVPPIELDVRGLELVPGKPDEPVEVCLFNRLKEMVTGEVRFEPVPGLELDPPAVPFTMQAGAWGMCRFRLTAGEGAHAVRVHAVCPPEDNPGLGLAAPLITRPRQVTFRSVPLDRAYAWEDGENETVWIETPTLAVSFHLRGGSFTVRERLSGSTVLQQSALAVGPPFDRPSATQLGEHRIETADGRVRLTLSVRPEAAPGVIVERTLTVSAGPFLRLDHRVRNTTGIEQRPQLRLEGKVPLYRGITLPLAGGLVHEILEGLGDFPLPDQDLPRDPAAYSEGWLAWEEYGLVAGIVWKSCTEIAAGSVQLDLPAVAPGSSVDADPLHFVVARGDWELVRGLWRRLWQPGRVREERHPQAHPVLDAGFEPSPLLVAAERTAAPLVVRNRRLKPFDGRWELRAGASVRSEPAGGELSGVTMAAPAHRDLELTCPDLTPRVVPAAVALSSEGTSDERDAPILVVGDASREVTVEPAQPAQDTALWQVDNGWLGFSVAPGHHGALVSLRRNGRELLSSSFPEPRPHLWMSAWFGGVEPFLRQHGDVRHTRDLFTGAPAERTGARGLAWRGVSLSCQVCAPDMGWLELSIEYLTTGASNLIALVQRLANRSAATQETAVGFLVFPTVSAETRVRYDVRRPDYRRGGSTAERDTVPRLRIPASAAFRFGDARWVAMDTAGSLLTLVSLLPGDAGGWLLDRENAGLYTLSTVHLEPGETVERLAWLAVSADPSQARDYRVLSTLGELP